MNHEVFWKTSDGHFNQRSVTPWNSQGACLSLRNPLLHNRLSHNRVVRKCCTRTGKSNAPCDKANPTPVCAFPRTDTSQASNVEAMKKDGVDGPWMVFLAHFFFCSWWADDKHGNTHHVQKGVRLELEGLAHVT